MINSVLWAIRVYTFLIIVWALSTWFGGLPQPIAGWMNILMWPVIVPFGWVRIGGFGLGPVVALLLLYGMERWLHKYAGSAPTNVEPWPVEDERRDS